MSFARKKTTTHGLDVALDISVVPTPTASRELCGLVDQQLVQSRLIKGTLRHQLEADDLRSFLRQGDARRRHGSTRDTSDIAMMRSRRGEEDDLVLPAWRRVEDGRDYGQVGQMGPTGDRRVGEEHVSWVKLALPPLELKLDGKGHGAQVDRDEGGIGDEVTGVAEQGARVVEPFFDVGRDRRLLQRAAHSLGDVHEPVGAGASADD